MVGRKTSPRCDNCRQRKVKCDLSRPSCTQCVKKRLQCPGYDTESRFFVYNAGDSSATSSSGELSDSSNDIVYNKKRNRLVVTRAPPLDPVDSLRGKFVSRLTSRAVAARFIVIPEHYVLQHIPRRLGSNRALDDAVKCICTTSSTSSNGSMAHGAIYSDALNSLQKALNHPDQSITSETLAAAVLLQMFEHSVDHAEFRWVVHANGVINILKLRGPSCIKNDLDRSILHAQVGNIWFKSMQEGTGCFLNRPEWKETVFETFREGDNVNAEWSIMIRSGLSIPDLLCGYEQLESEDACDLSMAEDKPPRRDGYTSCASLILDLGKARQELSELRTRFQLQKANEANNDPSKSIEQPRPLHASRLAVNVFSILIEYMLETVLSTDIGAKAAHEDLFDMISMSGYVTTSGRLNSLASAAKSELDSLRLADKIAAGSTGTLSRIMVRKVLDAPVSRKSKLKYLTPIVERLYESLTEDCSENSMQPDWTRHAAQTSTP